MHLSSLALLAALLPLPLAAQTHATHTTATHHRAPASDDAALHNVFWQPNALHQGSPLFVTVELERPAAHVTGTIAGKPLAFFHEQDNPRVWHALGGIDLDTNPGSYNLDITASLAGGRIAHTSKQLDVAAGDFKTGDVTVPENYVNPTDTEQKQIAGDDELKRRTYSHSTPHLLWSGDFVKPISAAPTPSFGESRILNEEKTSLHTGTDYPAKEDTPVVASNSGTVVLTHDLFYEGNTIVIDHGHGLFTVYLHLSRTDVKEGDAVQKGDRIGLTGASGRVTGPHLHFAVRWQGAWLDPQQVLALTLPKTPAAEEEHRPTPRRAARRR